MKTVNITSKYEKTVFLLITHKIKGFKNIVVSGKKIYQLPCTIKNRSFDLKEIVKKGYYYWIESKPYSRTKLLSLAYKRSDKYALDIDPLYPFAY